MTRFTNRERFFTSFNSQGQPFAPLSLGTGEYTDPVDYTVFKKTKAEKVEVKKFKILLGKTKNHKFVSFSRGSY